MIRIENIGGKSLPNYVLFTPKGLIAIDTGFEWKRKAFMEGLRKTGETLQYLFLTHSHDDHVGFAKKVIDVTGASLIVHHASIPALVRGGCEIAKHGAYTSKRVAVLGRIQSVLNMPKAGFSPLTIKSSDIVIANETQQPFADIGIRIVFLPGHVKDQMGIFIEDHRALFCGDAAMNTILNIGCYPIWMEDLSASKNTWKKMIKLNPRIIYPAHGKPMVPKDLVKNIHRFDNRTLYKRS